MAIENINFQELGNLIGVPYWNIRHLILSLKHKNNIIFLLGEIVDTLSAIVNGCYTILLLSF